VLAKKEVQSTSDNLENIMGSLSGYSDREINGVITKSFGFCEIMSELDASSLYVLLQDMKDEAENNQTTWFDFTEMS